VSRLVVVLEVALAHDDFHEGLSAANQLVAVTTRLLEEEPLRDPAADVELAAALRVYRNAAFAFRGLFGASDEKSAAMASACSTLLDQANDLLARFNRQRPDLA